MAAFGRPLEDPLVEQSLKDAIVRISPRVDRYAGVASGRDVAQGDEPAGPAHRRMFRAEMHEQVPRKALSRRGANQAMAEPSSRRSHRKPCRRHADPG